MQCIQDRQSTYIYYLCYNSLLSTRVPPRGDNVSPAHSDQSTTGKVNRFILICDTNYARIYQSIELTVTRYSICKKTNNYYSTYVYMCPILFRLWFICMYVFLSIPLISLKLFLRKSPYLVCLLLQVVYKCHEHLVLYNP